MSTSTAVERWFKERTFKAEQFALDDLLTAKSEAEIGVDVCLPTRNVAATLGPTLQELGGLVEAGLIDRLIVVDANSDDGSAEIAREGGAEVYQENDLMTTFGPCQGKGDALWRVLSVTSGEFVVFVDSDSHNFSSHYITGLLGPLVTEPAVQLVKAAYRRPYSVGQIRQEEGGGRVNELCARPLINLFYPQLAGMHQLLAGEVAAKRELLYQLPFYSNYAVEIALLIDSYKCLGLDGLAQVDLGTRINTHQSLADLGVMANSVTLAVFHHLVQEGRATEPSKQFLQAQLGDNFELVDRTTEIVVRPPLQSLVGAR